MTKLERIRARLEKATPGPWKRMECGLRVETSTCSSIYVGHIKNVRFIANAPTDIAHLLKIVEKAEKMAQFYADGFRIMDHIDGTYEIKTEWYQKAREFLEGLKE